MSEHQNEKTSLERSHSKSSNAKLTLLCFFTILAFSCLWVGLAFADYEPIPAFVAWIMVAAGGVLTLIGLVLFHHFSR